MKDYYSKYNIYRDLVVGGAIPTPNEVSFPSCFEPLELDIFWP